MGRAHTGRSPKKTKGKSTNIWIKLDQKLPGFLDKEKDAERISRCTGTKETRIMGILIQKG